MTGQRYTIPHPRVIHAEAVRRINDAAHYHNRGYSPFEREKAAELLAAWMGIAKRLSDGVNTYQAHPALADMALILARKPEGDRKQ